MTTAMAKNELLDEIVLNHSNVGVNACRYTLAWRALRTAPAQDKPHVRPSLLPCLAAQERVGA